MKRITIYNLNRVRISSGIWLNERQIDIYDLHNNYISYGITHDGRMLNLYNRNSESIGYGIINQSNNQILIYDQNRNHISTGF